MRVCRNFRSAHPLFILYFSRFFNLAGQTRFSACWDAIASFDSECDRSGGFLSRSYFVILQCKPINNNTSEKNNETFDAPALNGADDRLHDRLQER